MQPRDLCLWLVELLAGLFFKLDQADIIHHAVSVGLVGSIGYLVRWGAVLSAMDFFICGLPGGLDYAMLALGKMGVLQKITIKRVNLWLQVAIRWPGILLVLYNGAMSKIHGAPEAAIVGWAPMLLVGVLHGWNGLYYAQRVCGNTYVAEYKLKMEKAEAKLNKSEESTAGETTKATKGH